MLRQEQALRVAMLRQADLMFVRRLVQVHLDRELLHAANADARKQYRVAGGTLRLRHRGWKRVRFVLRSGLLLLLHTPYLRPLPPKKKTRRKKKPARGAGGAGVYPLLEKGEQHPEHRPIYLASLGNADAVMEQVVGLLRRLGAHLAAAVVFVSDGASWIWERLPAVIRRSGLSAAQVRCVLDFWHACEYVHEVLKLCRHLKDKARKSLYRALRHRLRAEVDGAAVVIKMLQPLARGRRAKAIGKAASVPGRAPAAHGLCQAARGTPTHWQRRR